MNEGTPVIVTEAAPPPPPAAASRETVVVAVSNPGGRLVSRFRGQSDQVDNFHLSFADLMSLLLVFFVILFAMTAGRKPQVSPAPVVVKQIDAPPQPVARPAETGADPLLFAAAGSTDGLAADAYRQRQWAAGRRYQGQGSAVNGLLGGGDRPDLARRQRRVAGLLARLKLLVHGAIKPGQVRVFMDHHQMVIVLAERITFASAGAELTPQVRDLLIKLARLAAAAELRVRVAGHTDDRPVHGGRLVSNWELSAGRAAAVAKFLIRSGVTADRVSIQGFAATRPVADNDSAFGRAKNRRVEIRLSLPPGA